MNRRKMHGGNVRIGEELYERGCTLLWGGGLVDATSRGKGGDIPTRGAGKMQVSIKKSMQDAAVRDGGRGEKVECVFGAGFAIGERGGVLFRTK